MVAVFSSIDNSCSQSLPHSTRSFPIVTFIVLTEFRIMQVRDLGDRISIKICGQTIRKNRVVSCTHGEILPNGDRSQNSQYD